MFIPRASEDTGQNILVLLCAEGFPCGSAVKNPPEMGLEDPLEEGGHGKPLQYSLGNPMDRRAWQAMVHGVVELDTTEVTMHPCSVCGRV